MATVVLVRHAVTAATGSRLGGRTPAPLTEEGRAQAEAVAERLAHTRLAAVYASPIRRTLETAATIAARQRRDVRQLDGVQEFDYGSWTDRSLKQLRRTRLFESIQQTPGRVTFPGGESFVAAQSRAVLAIEQVVNAHPGKATIAVVSHADVIKIVIAHYAGIQLDLFQRLVISPGSVSQLALPRRGIPRLLGLNDVSHLDRR
ncbi:MAG: histidine phosphatase family protein [Actinomycetota bacterium]|nr:histidine phosphatase family protein [Actinomycetota bacterium]